MGSLLQPTGSQPAAVYWRRRALVIGVALAVVIVLAVVLWPKSSPVAAPQSSTTPAATAPAPTPTSLTSATPTPTATATTPAAPQPCDPASVRVGLAGFKKLKAGTAQAFKVSLANTGAVPCVLAASSDNVTVAITSGKDRIWSTADCQKWVPAKKATLAPQQSSVLTVNWGGARSSATCKTTKATVPAGTYLAKATFTGAEPARLVMVLSP